MISIHDWWKESRESCICENFINALSNAELSTYPCPDIAIGWVPGGADRRSYAPPEPGC